MPNLFSVPIFFILLRETLETSIVVSILLSFVRQVFQDDLPLQRRLEKQIWVGTIIGLSLSLAIGASFIAIWYTIASNLWSSSENLWEGSFSLLATVLVTVVGLGMLKTSHMHEKWRVKLANAVEGKDKNFGRRFALLLLPLVTVLREGLESMVFLGGISIGESPSSIPLAAAAGILTGLVIGFLIYRGGSVVQLHWFFVTATCVLLLVAAGLFSRAIGNFESHAWAVYTGGAGGDEGTFVDVRTNVWYLNCCDPKNASSGWIVFKGILGWTNIASVGTVTGYCLYWVVVIVTLGLMKWKELKMQRRKEKEAEEGELKHVDDVLKQI